MGKEKLDGGNIVINGPWRKTFFLLKIKDVLLDIAFCNVFHALMPVLHKIDKCINPSQIGFF
jgi:hypothetical protein